MRQATEPQFAWQMAVNSNHKEGAGECFPGPARPPRPEPKLRVWRWFYWSCKRKNWLAPVAGTVTWLSEPATWYGPATLDQAGLVRLDDWSSE